MDGDGRATHGWLERVPNKPTACGPSRTWVGGEWITAKLEVFHHAIQGLITLESDPEKQAKYADWVDIYSQLDDNEIREYAERYPQEVQVMAGFAQRYRDEGWQDGRQEGEDIGFGKGWQKGRQDGSGSNPAETDPA